MIEGNQSVERLMKFNSIPANKLAPLFWMRAGITIRSEALLRLIVSQTRRPHLRYRLDPIDSGLPRRRTSHQMVRGIGDDPEARWHSGSREHAHGLDSAKGRDLFPLTAPLPVDIPQRPSHVLVSVPSRVRKGGNVFLQSRIARSQLQR